jgi:pantetheine-phosphate adenylyltransferase
MSKIAIFPGSFDPVTNGHIDLIKRAAEVFDKVIVGVAIDTHKEPLFNTDEREDMAREVLKDVGNITIQTFSGLVVNFAKKSNANVLVRGLRMISDFEYELQMAQTNRRIDNTVETVFLMPTEESSFLSSSLIKQVASLGAELSSFVPEYVAKKLKEKLASKKIVKREA